MVSLNERQALANLAGTDPQMKRFQCFLSGEKLRKEDACGVHEELLQAISIKDNTRFKEVAERIGQRKISVDSDWCHDDYLIFLLLLGHELFGRPLTFLSQIIEVRRNNPNPIPRKINDFFSSLERHEFGIDGEFCFLKIPFLHLVGKLHLGPTEALRALRAISVPGLTDQMPPFLHLLTITAHDLILTERQPIETETVLQLMDGLEAHSKNLSLRQWWRILTVLPGRMIWTLLVFGAGLSSILFGFGKELFAVYHKSIDGRTRPSIISVVGIHDVSTNLPIEALWLARTLPQDGSGKRNLFVTVEGAPFGAATPAFIVEASHPEKPIKGAFAFTQASSEGIRPFTVVPVQRDGGRFRAIIPEQPKGQRLCFVLEFEADAKDNIDNLGKRIVLRPLQ
jgi:hypothetical protein